MRHPNSKLVNASQAKKKRANFTTQLKVNERDLSLQQQLLARDSSRRPSREKSAGSAARTDPYFIHVHSARKLPALLQKVILTLVSQNTDKDWVSKK